MSRFRLKKSTKNALMGVFAVLLLISCPGILLLAADVACSANIEEWLPIYPGAEMVSVQYDYFRARALGTTTMQLTSTEEAETIRQFYRDIVIRMAEAQNTRGLASTHWQVEEGEDSSTIYLYSECGSA
jgi:hypothetical protein